MPNRPRRGPRPVFTALLRAYVTPAMHADLEAEADAGETTVAGVVRDAIARGLPLVRADRRKRERADRAKLRRREGS